MPTPGVAAHDEQATPAGRGLDARLAQRVELTPAPDERGSHGVTVTSAHAGADARRRIVRWGVTQAFHRPGPSGDLMSDVVPVLDQHRVTGVELTGGREEVLEDVVGPVGEHLVRGSRARPLRTRSLRGIVGSVTRGPVGCTEQVLPIGLGVELVPRVGRVHGSSVVLSEASACHVAVWRDSRVPCRVTSRIPPVSAGRRSRSLGEPWRTFRNGRRWTASTARWADQWAADDLYRFDRSRGTRRGVRDRHAAADRVGLAPRRARLQLHAHRHRGPLPAHARQAGLLPDGVGRQRAPDRASRPELLRRALRPEPAVRGRLRAAVPGRPAEGPSGGADLAAELPRAVRRAGGDRRARCSRRCSAGSG